jgi:hypothetical protein
VAGAISYYLLAFDAVFLVASFLFWSDGSPDGIFKKLTDGIAGPLVARHFWDERCSDLKSVGEGASVEAVDVAFAKLAEDLVDGQRDTGSVFDGGQQKHAGFDDMFIRWTARGGVVVAEDLSLEGGGIAFVSAGQNMSTFVVHE